MDASNGNNHIATFEGAVVEFLQDGSLLVDGEFIPKKIFLLDLPHDAIVVVISAITLFILRHVLTAYVFKWLGRRENLTGDALIRFCENIWYATFYVVQLSIGFYILSDAEWMPWNDVWKLVTGWPHVNDKNLGTIRLYYLAQMGYYVQGIIGLLFIDVRMKDFHQMVLHHLLTLVLVMASLVAGYHRYGTVIFLLHDVVDVFLYVGKTYHQANKQVMANICFVFFILSLALLRLGLLPYLIYVMFVSNELYRHPGWHILLVKDTSTLWPFEFTSYATCAFQWCITNYFLFSVALMGLVLMHVFWFYLSMKLLVKTIQNGGDVPGDLREEDFDDKFEEKSSKEKKTQ